MSEFGANTLYKTTLAIHDERLSVQKEQVRYLLSTIHRYQTAVAKEIKDLRDNIEEKDDETYRFISGKFDEFENRLEERLQRVYDVIRDEEKKVQVFFEYENKRSDDRYKTVNDFMIKIGGIPSQIKTLISKVEKLENWKWYIMGLGAATSILGLWNGFFDKH